MISYQVLSGCGVEKVSRRSPAPNRLQPSLPSSGWSWTPSSWIPPWSDQTTYHRQRGSISDRKATQPGGSTGERPARTCWRAAEIWSLRVRSGWLTGHHGEDVWWLFERPHAPGRWRGWGCQCIPWPCTLSGPRALDGWFWGQEGTQMKKYKRGENVSERAILWC